MGSYFWMDWQTYLPTYKGSIRPVLQVWQIELVSDPKGWSKTLEYNNPEHFTFLERGKIFGKDKTSYTFFYILILNIVAFMTFYKFKGNKMYSGLSDLST